MAGNLGHLAATVSLNIDPFKASARTLSSTIKATTAELKAQDMAFKGSSKSVAGMKTVYGTLERQAKQYEAQLKREKQTLDERTAAVKKGGDDMEKLTTREANAASAYNKTAASIANLNNRMSAMSKQITLQSSGWYKASQGAARLAAVSGKAGKALTSFGSKATMSVTAPLAAGFTMAAKSAIDFNSQIDAIGPLMTNGAAVTGKYKAQLDQLASASKQWSVQYGISTTSINAGLADLIRAGYNAGQSMKMMPAILDASRASGEDFNSVMEVVTSTMTQFGVQAGNTTSVTDAMTYAANATKSGFGDMGEAMQYTGQSAHAAGVSLNETVADIGLLSNAGLQGSMAGTAFNMALQKLAGASTKANSPMAKLGVNIKAFKAGQIGLPEVIDQITKSTSGMSKASKVAAINAAFGERGGRAVLGLVNAGAPAMRKLTAETEKASGATKKVSDMMGNTAKANFDKLKSSIQVLAIEVGENLLPAITPMIAKATDMVKAFGNLDKGTQQSIINFALLATAVGPVSSALGRLFNVVKIGSTGFSAVAGGIVRLVSSAKLGGTAMQVLSSTFSKTAFSAMKVAPAVAEGGTAMSGMATSGTGLLATLAPMAPAILGVTAVVGAGYAAWEIWGKKAYEAGQRAGRWGSDIGAAADKSATAMKTASGKISGALDDTNNSVSHNSKTIVQGFDAMTAAAKKTADESEKAAVKLGKSLGGNAQSDLMAETNKEQKANSKRIAQMQANAKQVASITRNSSKNNVALTAEQETMIENLRQDSAAQAVKTLSLSGKQQSNVLKAILGERVTMTKAQAIKQGKATSDAMFDEWQLYKKQQKQINDDSTLTAGQRHAALEGLEQDHNQKMSDLAISQIQAMRRTGASEKQIIDVLAKANGMSLSQAVNAVDKYDAAMSKGAQSTKGFAAVVKNDMSASVKKAGNDWNSLVLDPKTGKVKTNLPEVLKDTANTKTGWNKLVFDLKYAKISSNAKQTIVEALAASNQWKSMPEWQKNAIIRTQGRGELANVMEEFRNWNSFTPKQQQAIIHGDYTALTEALIKLGYWNELAPKEKAAVVSDKATIPLMDALVANGKWNDLPAAAKQAVVTAKGTKELGDAVIKYGLWNELPQKTKDLLINDSDVRTKIIKAGILMDDYNLNKKPKTKTLAAETADFNKKFMTATGKVKTFNDTSPGPAKQAKATDNASGKLGTATKSTMTFAKTGTGPAKQAKGLDLASGNLGRATGATKSFRGASTGATKVAKGKDSASKAIGTALKSWTAFGGNETVNKIVNIGVNIAKGAKSLLSKFGLATGTQNFQGGLAMINDAPGSRYQEMVTLPNGMQFMAAGRNAILPLPQHTKVETAMRTATKYPIPRFASGTTDYTGATTQINRMQTVTVAAPVQSDSGVGDTLQTLNALVAALLNSKQEFTGQVVLDNKTAIGTWIAETVRKEIQKHDKIVSRQKGVLA